MIHPICSTAFVLIFVATLIATPLKSVAQSCDGLFTSTTEPRASSAERPGEHMGLRYSLSSLLIENRQLHADRAAMHPLPQAPFFNPFQAGQRVERSQRTQPTPAELSQILWMMELRFGLRYDPTTDTWIEVQR